MITLKSVITKACAESIYKYQPIPKVICDALDHYITNVLVPLVENENPEVRSAANLVYQRFVNGFPAEAPVVTKDEHECDENGQPDVDICSMCKEHASFCSECRESNCCGAGQL